LPLLVHLAPPVRAVEAPQLQLPLPQPTPCPQRRQQLHRLQQREPHAVLGVLPLARRPRVRALLRAPLLQHWPRAVLAAPQLTLHPVMLM
jgi:hypothetical protein